VISKGFEEDPDGLVVTFLHEFRHDGGARFGKHGCALIRVWRHGQPYPLDILLEVVKLFSLRT